MKELRLNPQVIILGIIISIMLLSMVSIVVSCAPSPSHSVSEVSTLSPTASQGLGLSREEIIDYFVRLGYTFKEKGSNIGIPLFLGEVSYALDGVQVWGPPENVSEIDIAFFAQSQDPDVWLRKCDYIVTFLDRFIAPGSGVWFKDQVAKIEYGDVDSSKTFGNRQVHVQLVPGLSSGSICNGCLTISPPYPP